MVRQALVGAALGTVVGLTMMPSRRAVHRLGTAALGYYLARHDHGRALKVDTATQLGMLVALITRLLLASTMVWGVRGQAGVLSRRAGGTRPTSPARHWRRVVAGANLGGMGVAP